MLSSLPIYSPSYVLMTCSLSLSFSVPLPSVPIQSPARSAAEGSAFISPAQASARKGRNPAPYVGPDCQSPRPKSTARSLLPERDCESNQSRRQSLPDQTSTLPCQHAPTQRLMIHTDGVAFTVEGKLVRNSKLAMNRKSSSRVTTSGSRAARAELTAPVGAYR